MSRDIQKLMQTMRPAERADSRAARLAPDVLAAIEHVKQQRNRRRNEWTLQLAAMVVALSIGLIWGESSSRKLLMQTEPAHDMAVIAQMPGHE